MNLAAGTVYIAVPGQHLRVEDTGLVLDRNELVNTVRPSADVLFVSAAPAFGPHVVGVVLSGTGRDRAHGCLEIKANGGMIIGQDEHSARHFGMAGAAIGLEVVNYVLPSSEISQEIAAVVHRVSQ